MTQTQTDEQISERLAALQAERAELERAVTIENAQKIAADFCSTTARLLESRVPAGALVDSARFGLEQRLDVIARYVVESDAFREFVGSEIARSQPNRISAKAKAKEIRELDAKIGEVRAESNARVIAAAKREAEERVAALERELAATA